MSIINDLNNVLTDKNPQEALNKILEKEYKIHLQQQKEILIFF